MKIVHMTSVHTHPDVRIYLKECVSLACAGFDVELVAAGAEDHTTSGVKILGVPKASGRISRMSITAYRVYRRARREKADLYHLHDPELLPIGMMLQWSGAKVIYDAHEDLPRQILSKHWIPASLRRLISWITERLENYIAIRLSGVVAATPHIAERFMRINPNTVNVNNYPLPNEHAPQFNNHVRKQQVCYIGGITRERGIRSLVEALPLINGLCLVLCGRFTELDFENELRMLPGWAQVDYRGQVDREEVGIIMADSIAGIVTLLPTISYIDSLPIKMFEYMSAELPVIASNFPLWRRIIEDADCGICIDPANPQAIAAAIRQLSDNPEMVDRLGRAGRDAVLTKYNWSTESKKLIDLYKVLL